MPKKGEIDYLKNLGDDGVSHAARKPFSDPNCPQYLAEMGAIMLLLPRPPATVLDLGCGTGWTSLFLAKAGYWVTGIDISEDMIRVANELREAEKVEAVRFMMYDYEKFGLGGAFDSALFFDALHHSEDETAAIAAVHKALKPGGVCVVSEPGKGHERSPEAIEARRRYGVTERDMPPSRIIRAGKKAGFRRFKIYPHARGLHAAIYGDPQANLRRGLLRGCILRGFAALVAMLVLRKNTGIVVMTK